MSFAAPMPETARILQFPSREVPRRSAQEALGLAREYLELPQDQRPDDFTQRLLSDVDVSLAICSLVKDLIEVSPEHAASEASALYHWIEKQEGPLGLFDEHDYLLGESARLAAWATRFIGRYAESEKWLNLAESAFQHTVNPAPLLASIGFARLLLRYQTNQFAEVSERLPSLRANYAKLGMDLEVAKCCFLEARLLQQLGKDEEAYSILSGLRRMPVLEKDRGLFGQVLVYVGAHQAQVGNLSEALRTYSEAIPVIKSSNRPIALAELKWALGDTYKSQGNVEAAVEAYRAARQEFAKIGMPTYEAMLHLATADTLLAAERPREAEWEILAALPAIEKSQMVPEAIAAAALLRESVRTRKTDRNALQTVREHLKKTG